MSEKVEQIKALRELTGISMSVCKNALEKSDFDQARAMQLLKEWGAVDADRRRDRKVAEGRVLSYIHGAGRVGVLLQVDCETDFVAKSDDFASFMHEVCLQVAALNPMFVDRADVPEATLSQEKIALITKAQASGKPAAMIEKIVNGQIEKWYGQVCLLDQVWVKDPSKRVRDLLNELVQKTGENVRINRFARFEAGTVASAT